MHSMTKVNRESSSKH